MLPNYRVESFLSLIGDDLGANGSAALHDSHDDNFIFPMLALAADSPLTHALVHVARFAADKSFVRLYFARAATKFHKRAAGQCYANAMIHKPCRLLCDLEVSGDLITADSIFA